MLPELKGLGYSKARKLGDVVHSIQKQSLVEAVQLRNHRNPVAGLEYLRGDGLWAAVARTD
jgi:expansin (peptidoglycan-binding protein)